MQNLCFKGGDFFAKKKRISPKFILVGLPERQALAKSVRPLVRDLGQLN
jgi:hypothetical protein